jgi:transposase
MRAWLDQQAGDVRPKSPIGEAVQYALRQWDALTRYLDDPALDLDNNEAERALRGIAVGRKNYLFMGSDRGGRAAAFFYSLIQSAKRHGLDPFRYLRDLFYRLPGLPLNDLDQLLPDHWLPVLN